MAANVVAVLLRALPRGSWGGRQSRDGSRTGRVQATCRNVHKGSPVRSCQKMPFDTRRPSTHFTPTYVGSSGSTTDASKFVRSNRATAALLEET